MWRGIIELGGQFLPVRSWWARTLPTGEILVSYRCRSNSSHGLSQSWSQQDIIQILPSHHPTLLPLDLVSCSPKPSSHSIGHLISPFAPGLLPQCLPSFLFTAKGRVLLGALTQMTEALKLSLGPAIPAPCSPASDGAAAVNGLSAQKHNITSHLYLVFTHCQNLPLLYPLSTRQSSQMLG